MLIRNLAEEEQDLPSREELENKYGEGSAAPRPVEDKQSQNKQYKILKPGDSLDGNEKQKKSKSHRQFSDAQIDVKNPRSESNNTDTNKKVKKQGQNDDFDNFFSLAAEYILYTLANRSGTIRLYNIKSRKYEFWVDDVKFDFSEDNIYTVATGRHVIKIRRFGYDDIVFKANVRPRSEFKVVCNFKQSPFYCFDLYTSQDDLNPKLGEKIYISFDVNRNVVGKKVTCEIKNEETGTVVFTKEFSNFTTFTQTFTFDGKDKDGNHLPDGQYSVDLIYDDMMTDILSESISVDSTLSANRSVYKKFLFWGSIPKAVNNCYILQNNSCYGCDFPCNNSASVLKTFRVGGYLNKGLSILNSIFISFPISNVNIGLSCDRQMHYGQIPIKFKIFELYNARSSSHFVNSVALCLNYDSDRREDNAIVEQQNVELNQFNHYSATPHAVENKKNDNVQHNWPISMDLVIFITLQRQYGKIFKVLDLMFNPTLLFRKEKEPYGNLFYLCISFRIKELDSISLAFDMKTKKDEYKPYCTISFLHRFEFTLISVGWDIRVNVKEIKNSSLALKFFIDF